MSEVPGAGAVEDAGAPERRAIRFGLATKLSVLTSALVLAVAGGISAFVLTDQRTALTEQITARGRAVAKNLAANVAAPLLQGDKAELVRLVKSLEGETDVVYVVVTDEKDIVLAHTDLLQVGKEYLPEGKVEKLGKRTELVQTFTRLGGTQTVDVAMAVRYANTATIGQLHLGLSAESVQQAVRAQLVKILLVGFVALALGLLGAIVLANLIVRPVRVLAAGAYKIGGGHLDHRIEVSSADELGQLADAFNAMTYRLRRAQDEMIEKQRMEEDLRVAHEIQQSLLPTTFPEVPGFDLHAMYRAAKEVGGDYFDFIPVSDRHLGLVVADVSGKGVPGSMGMAVTRTILRAQATGQLDAAAVLSRVNRMIWHDIKRGMFVSVLYAVLDGASRKLYVASAGHNPMYIFRAKSGEVETLSLTGLALGLDPGPLFDRRVQGKEVAMAPGDVAVLYTDGVTEAMDERQREFGDDALIEVIRTHGSLPARELVHKINEAVSAFVRDTPQSDDITVMAVQAK